ncbi:MULTISPECIES: hypothetical protein [Alloalcanivorax]|jgi:hypothetical protein|uniref:Uncharacterized protein n=2 Tax=Alloalcanivorax TaxID=3020832 RepID=K0CCW6_ALCDB|nr:MULTISPECIES: hypothetical protein [Alloalcanivorax]ERS05701.1 hypothetical protein Q668_05540 [Alcanivorax sp. PN-3]AFT70388.1 hypothetical protein B5T_02114 [Alloalcanivorax dieselolei B5]ARB45732.1 hypothetical protein P40_10135 [Alloalcanivorax xenomutans]MCE7511183.1 hypothetical protein [Alloalcanivorax xenomutans]CUR46896.1 hypothetical protein BN2364_2455 [Alloalcanivorax xenomutans]
MPNLIRQASHAERNQNTLMDGQHDTSTFQFKRVDTPDGGVTFRQYRHPGREGVVLDVSVVFDDPLGAATATPAQLLLDLRRRYRRDSGRMGEQRIFQWFLDAHTAVQLASVLILIADTQLQDLDEQPHTTVVAEPEKADFGYNWVRDDMATAATRLEQRKQRSHLFGLVQRCLELCDERRFIQELTLNLAAWAERSGDGYAAQKATSALAQIGLISERTLN